MLLGETLVTVTDLTKSFGDKEVLKSATFTIHRGARIGVIGPNGTGKSTFMRVLAGEETDFGGSVKTHPEVRVGYIAQEPPLDESKNVRENVEVGLARIHEMLEKYDALSEAVGNEADPDAMQKILDKMGRLQEEIEAIDAWEWEHHRDLAMEAMRLPPADSAVTNLSGGERRRIALCRELVASPDLLILDEPTNHLDAATIEWLEVFLDQYPGTVLMVTHDRYFLDNVANYMVELENGRLMIYEGNYSDYLEKKAKIMAQRARSEERRQRILERELKWLNSTPAARTAKSKARVKEYEKLADEDVVEGPGTVQLVIPKGPRLGNRVLEVRNVRKGFGDRELIRDLSFDVVPGQIVGITGPNGVGKTTLFRMITGQDEPDAGAIEIGSTVKMTYVDQTRENLDPDKTVYEEISEGRDVIDVGGRELHIREYLSGFQFKGSAQQTPVGKLSGGERNRLLLAKTMRRGANLLLLDEPTNDLDLTTLRVLEEALETFAGSALIVSHDRFFLDRLANLLVIFEDRHAEDDGASRPRVFNGNFEHYFETRRSELDAAGVKEGKYRKTTYRKIRR